MTTNHTSYWDINKEVFVNAELDAILDGKSIGIPLLSYLDKNVIAIKPEFSMIASKMFFDWNGDEKYIFLQLAKMGALMFEDG
jgi:hypothetical protein